MLRSLIFQPKHNNANTTTLLQVVNLAVIEIMRNNDAPLLFGILYNLHIAHHAMGNLGNMLDVKGKFLNKISDELARDICIKK